MPTRKPLFAFWGPVVAGVLITPLCIMLAVVLAAGGHGSYWTATLLYPLTMLSTAFTGNIGESGIALAVLQFPIYGAILGAANKNGRVMSRLGILLVAHVLLAISCLLLLPGPAF